MKMISPLVLGLSLVLTGCTSEAEKRAQAEQAAALARAQAELTALKAREAAAEEARKAQAAAEAEARTRKEQEKQAFAANPAPYFEAGDIQVFDKGIVNRYREIVKLSLLNKSQYAVRNIKGEIELIDDSGAGVAKVPFSVTGALAAGDSKTFAKQAGTLSTTTVQTNANRYRIKVTHIALVNP